ncbi:hypothetical protein K469DRAFT_719202 [Zopfia rhizophila CBS 207.26]|uniref:Uncharacterized protein n=1 Tax=Zopfia rhizophila CBS 207.26 TaxID=1314779 RepID=A0A6A6DJC4_9PEZI|nr:hypothetical protein K469DRAFT_719202 [Zopfia rhizophila CBS 207.26]
MEDTNPSTSHQEPDAHKETRRPSIGEKVKEALHKPLHSLKYGFTEPKEEHPKLDEAIAEMKHRKEGTKMDMEDKGMGEDAKRL